MNRKKDQFIFGWHPVLEAIETGKEIQKVLVQKGVRHDRYAQVTGYAREREIPVQYVPTQKLDRITRKAHQGVIAILSPIEFADLSNLIASIYENGETPRLLACDGITDVRNFGAICRSAECFGFHGVIVPGKGMAPLNEDAIKTSSGALMRLPICRVSVMNKALTEMQESGIEVIGMTEKTERLISNIQLSKPTCLVMGNEETGLSTDSLRTCDYLVRIPMDGKTQSLNVSVSAAIGMYTVMTAQHRNVD